MPPSTTASRGIPCSRRPGSPKPTRSRTRISGRPRKMSTYAVAAARSGKNTGPRAVLATARPSATTTMITADTAITRRLSQSPSATLGREDNATSTSKKDCRTRGQPGELVRTTTAIAVTTRVLTRATAVDRAACRRRNATRARWRSDGVQSLTGSASRLSCPKLRRAGSLEDRRTSGVGQPLRLEVGERPVRTQGVDGGRHGIGERAALVQDQAELVGGVAGRQLADQDAVLELGGGDVQRGRQVDDDRVDQTGGQCLLDLGRVVVAGGEVEVRPALVADRHLVDRDVEGLLAGGDDLVESHRDPLHRVLAEAQLGGDGVGDRGLEALPVRRVVVDDPGLVARVGGADGQYALGHRLQRAGVGRGGVAVVGRGAGCRGESGQGREGDYAEDAHRCLRGSSGRR